LGAERYRVEFTADRALHEQLQELRALMRHLIPDGDVGKILARGVAVLLAQVRKRKFAETARPTGARPSDSPNESSSRHIPAAIRRAVWRRDRGRCTYLSASSHCCAPEVPGIRPHGGLDLDAGALDRWHHAALPRPQ
jgi:hypothetical protein